MNVQAIRELRAAKVAEARTLISSTEARGMTGDEVAKFDALKNEIEKLEADEARAQFLADAERNATGERVHGDGNAGLAAIESRVSLLRVVQAQTEGRALTGAEAEFNAEMERRNGRKAQGIYVPLRALEKRVNTTTSASDLVGTDHRGDQYIEPLRNALLARKLGVRVLSGLRGNVEIPKAGSSVTSGWVAENSALSASDMTFDSVTLTPRHVGALSEMSRQLIQQSDPSIEALLRDDLSFAIAQAIDSALILGGGTNQPKGILSTAGIQTGSLATPSWAEVLAMLGKIEQANATANAWLTSPKVAEKLRGTLKSASAGSAYLLESGRMAELPVAVTNQVPNKAGSPAKGRAILGDFSQVILGIWSELDLLVNPFAETAYSKGNVLIRAMATCDIAVRHPEAFVVAEDVVIA